MDLSLINFDLKALIFERDYIDVSLSVDIGWYFQELLFDCQYHEDFSFGRGRTLQFDDSTPLSRIVGWYFCHWRNTTPQIFFYNFLHLLSFYI